MNESKQISSHASCFTVQCGRTLEAQRLPYISQSKQTFLVGCGFSNSTHFVGKIAAVIRSQTSALSKFCHPNKKKKKKKRTFVVSGGGGGVVRTPEPPLRTGLAHADHSAASKETASCRTDRVDGGWSEGERRERSEKERAARTNRR